MIVQLFKDVYNEELAKGAILNERMEGFREDYLILHCLLKKYNIKSCFEIGTHTGWGTMIIKNAVGSEGIVFSLDLPDEEAFLSKQHPLEKKERVGWECTLPYIQLRGDSRIFDFSAYLCEAYYCDGEHTFENVYIETLYILAQSPKLVVYHDVDMTEVARGILYALSENDEYELYRVEDTRIGYLLKK